MQLTPEQKQTIATWVAAGDSLSIVQKKLADEFKVSMTYMDVRFLVDDLGLELKNIPKADPKADITKMQPVAKEQPKPAADALPAESAEPSEEFAEAFPEDEIPQPGASSLKLEVDRVVRPGALASGKVTFSDGVSGKWVLDQMGRIALDTGTPGYKPSPEDVQAFQRQLSVLLQQQGY